MQPFMDSKDKVDIRLMNLLKAYDTLRLKRWSSVFVPPDIVDTSDGDSAANYMTGDHNDANDTGRGKPADLELATFLYPQPGPSSIKP